LGLAVADMDESRDATPQIQPGMQLDGRQRHDTNPMSCANRASPAFISTLPRNQPGKATRI
jgi:hypothetical protein